MNSTEAITAFINAIREISGVGICYYDLNSFFNYQKKGIKNNRGHYCAFCEKVRSLPNGRQSCEESDRREAIMLAKQYKSPFFYECHMGMRELVIPLLRDGFLLGVLFVGQCRTDSDYEDTIRANAKRMGGDPNEFLALYNQLPLLSKKDLLMIGTVLSQYFDMKILTNELLHPPTSPNTTVRDLPEAIRSYIQQNYRYGLSAKHIAEAFYVNASYASRCFSQRFHITLTSYVTQVRLERAKALLLTTDAPIGSIALNVGFDDLNYFSRVFKKTIGCTPTEYRTDHKK
ncbi:MAG: PocR ligand-binding domain-containing protein [Clostridia bacterium]|nr:PocR ligand-binding domain-containing protein [Clostridia bacterium]